MADVDSKITLKLLIDARSHRVIFGEAGKSFVDFMFSLLTLPLGFVIKLLSPQTMVGSIGKVYQSVENLNDTYFVVNRDKSTLLQPKVSALDVASPLLMSNERNAKFQPAPAFCTPSTSLFSPSSSIYGTPSISSSTPTLCTPSTSLFSSSSSMFGTMLCNADSFNKSSLEGRNGGFVKDATTYMITDDLEVTPMSAISSITLINRFNLKDAQLEEKVVVVGMKEGVALLKASLESSTVLTDVFCSSAEEDRTSISSMMDEVYL